MIEQFFYILFCLIVTAFAVALAIAIVPLILFSIFCVACLMDEEKKRKAKKVNWKAKFNYHLKPVVVRKLRRGQNGLTNATADPSKPSGNSVEPNDAFKHPESESPKIDENLNRESLSSDFKPTESEG